MKSHDAIDVSLLVLRMALGLTMAAHGQQKFFAGGRIEGTAQWFDGMGMKPGRFHALTAASTEVGSGLMLAMGLLTPFAAAAFVGLMFVAGWTVHRPNGFFSVRSGWELNFILAVTAGCLAGVGPGRWSLDRAVAIDDTLFGWLGLAIAFGLGLSAAVALLVVFYRPPAQSSG